MMDEVKKSLEKVIATPMYERLKTIIGKSVSGLVFEPNSFEVREEIRKTVQQILDRECIGFKPEFSVVDIGDGKFEVIPKDGRTRRLFGFFLRNDDGHQNR